MAKKPSSKKPAQKAKASSASAAPPPATITPPEPQEDPKHQQRLLDIFSAAFSTVLSSDNFPTLLQEIKQALFHRDFAGAFGRDDYLQAYAARWSPTRALCYSSVLRGLDDHLGRITTHDEGKSALRVVSIGGCAAEHVAVASYLCQSSNVSGRLTLVDSAPWSGVSSLLQERLTTPPQLSKYASAAAREANCELIKPENLSTDFVQADVLGLDEEALTRLLAGGPVLVTLFFTLNELYSEGGIGKTTAFLGRLGRALPHGSLLLVLDSPGSYSETALGKEQNKYPMHWLLDHTLLKADAARDFSWDKLESTDSKWFRLPESLQYPMQLENMRYQMHLYEMKRS